MRAPLHLADSRCIAPDARVAGAPVLTDDVQPTPLTRYALAGLAGRAPDGRSVVIDEKYEVLRLLGEGGMGAVYEARHRTTGRTFAVKVIAPTALARGVGMLARFQREARASGSIDSPYVVQTFDAGVDRASGAPYMAMECLVGEDVQSLVGRVGPLRPDAVLRICAHACHGLQKAHEAGIVHRDIKSANLFLAKRGGASGASDEIITKVLDFGIAKVRASPLAPLEDNKLTTTGSMLGSPVYMSPEQAIGAKDLDARSDLFSLGVMMYEALTGSTPNGHLDCLGALVMAICSQPAPPVQGRAPWVSAEVAAVVHKALAIQPSDRFPSAEAFREALVALLVRGDTTLRSDMLVPMTERETLQVATRAAASLEPSSPFVATVLSPATPPPPVSLSLPVSAAPAVALPARRTMRAWATIVASAMATVALVAATTRATVGHRGSPPERAPATTEASLALAPLPLVTASASIRELARSEKPTGRPADPAAVSPPPPTAPRQTSPRARGALTAAPKPPEPPEPPVPVPVPVSVSVLEEALATTPRPAAPKVLVPIDRGDPWSAK